MIQKINQACEKLNKKLGISIPLPNPGKRLLKAASICNFMLGAGLLAASVLFSSKSCGMLGGLSILSGVLLKWESGNKHDENHY